MNVTVFPSKLRGKANVPPSKSEAHRLLIAASLADGESILSGMAHSRDIDATADCMREFGASVDFFGDKVRVRGINASPRLLENRPLTFDCAESGSTLRFLIPIASVLAGRGKFIARGRLPERPQRPYEEIFSSLGGLFIRGDGFLSVKGNLVPGKYELRGDVSSQFFTGLLFSLPLLDGDSEIISTTPLESSHYVDMTLSAMRLAGIKVEAVGHGHWLIEGNQRYSPFSKQIEGDWSQAAFFLAGKSLGADIEATGCDENSLQGDSVITELLEKMKTGGEITLDISECPDLLPPAAAAAAMRGEGSITRFVGAKRLRMKESDRIASVSAALTAMGAKTHEGADFLTVYGTDKLNGGCTVDSANDHRIAMMAAITAAFCEKPVTILTAECVRKSYPDFWDVFKSLGGVISLEKGE